MALYVKLSNHDFNVSMVIHFPSVITGSGRLEVRANFFLLETPASSC